MERLLDDLLAFEVVPRVTDESTLGSLMLGCSGGNLLSRERMHECMRSWVSRNTNPLWAVRNARRGIDTSFANMVTLYGDRFANDCALLEEALSTCAKTHDPEGYASLLRMGAPFDDLLLVEKMQFDCCHTENEADSSTMRYFHASVLEAFFDVSNERHGSESSARSLDDLTRSVCLWCGGETKLRGRIELLGDLARRRVFETDGRWRAWLGDWVVYAMRNRKITFLDYAYAHGIKPPDEIIVDCLVDCGTRWQGYSFKDRKSGFPFFASYLDLEERTNMIMKNSMAHAIMTRLNRHQSGTDLFLESVRDGCVNKLFHFSETHFTKDLSTINASLVDRIVHRRKRAREICVKALAWSPVLVVVFILYFALVRLLRRGLSMFVRVLTGRAE